VASKTQGEQDFVTKRRVCPYLVAKQVPDMFDTTVITVYQHSRYCPCCN